MSHAPIETVEEDAADLQFPKGKYFSYQDFLILQFVSADRLGLSCGILVGQTHQHNCPIPPQKHTKNNVNLDYGMKISHKLFTDKSLPLANRTNRIVAHHTIRHTTCDQSTNEPHCANCSVGLQEPYINCAECPQYLSCLQCFAKGAESGDHQNTHAYIITHDNVKVLPNCQWSAREERQLLELLLRCGYGNWGDIAAGLTTKTATECRDHYHRYYFDGIFTQTLGLTRHIYWPETIPFMYKANSVEPPRHSLEMVQSKHMAGYRFARSDFDTPYDLSAESLISDLQTHRDWGDEWQTIGDTLNCAMVNAYNHRLR